MTKILSIIFDSISRMHECNIKIYLSIIFPIFIFHISLIESSINSEDSIYDPLKAWDLPDATAFPGQAFVYRLPNDYEQFEVSELELNFLPDWLGYDIVQNRLVGVAGQDDIGKLYFMEAKPSTHLWHSTSSPPIDIFKIEVEDSNRQELMLTSENNEDNEGFKRIHHHQHHFGRAIHCRKNKPVTTTSIVIDLDHDDNLSPFLKVLILERFSTHYEIPLKAVKFLSYNEVNDKNSQSNSVLVAGPGDYKRDKASGKKNNVVLHWTVGCGSVQKKHLSALQRLESEAKDGVLKEVLKYSVVGWFVTNSKLKETEMRRRRYLQNHYYPTSTATISILPPSTYATMATTTLASVKSTKASKPEKSERTKDPFPSWTKLAHIKANKSLKTIEMFVGEVFQMMVSRDFFSQAFRDLKLVTIGGQSLPSTSWIKLGSRNHLYGIPLRKHQGVQEYVLKAKDGQGNEADLKIDFNVRPAVLTRVPFEMSVVIENLDYERFMEEVDVRMNLTGKLASAFGDRDSSDVLMTHVGRGSVEYSWTNKSFLLSTLGSSQRGCSRKAVKALFNRFINASSGHLMDGFSRVMKNYRLSYAEALPMGDCERLMEGRVASYIRGHQVPPRERTRFHSTSLPPFDSAYDHSEEDTSHLGRVQNMDELFKQILVPSLIVVALLLLVLVIVCVAFSMRSNKKGDKLKGVDETIRKGTPVIFAHELDDNPPSLPSKRPLITSSQRSPKPPNYRQHMTSTAANLPATGKLYVPN